MGLNLVTIVITQNLHHEYEEISETALCFQMFPSKNPGIPVV
jgi:hypothetical protein